MSDDEAEAEFYEHLRQRMREARKLAGLTQQQLGDAMGLSRQSVNNVEMGRHNYSLLNYVRAVQALGLQVGDLLTDPMPVVQRAEPTASAMMDRPAYELVKLIEAELDDGDQVTDTPMRPNNIAIWGIRMLLEPYGGKPHRWQWPKCFECDHQLPLHNYGPCDLCGCAITSKEIVAGARDEDLDESVLLALRAHDEEWRDG